MKTLFPALILLLVAGHPSAAQPLRYLAFGDSITHGFGDPGISCTGASGGYPPRLQQRLANRGLATVFETSGACGERTVFGLLRIDSVLSPLQDVVILMEGTNDISARIGINTMVRNLAEMAERAEGVGLVPVHASVIPRNPDATPDGTNFDALVLSSLLADSATDNDRVFADPFDIFFDIPNLHDIYYSDFFHPNANGYDLLASTLEQASLEAAERARAEEACVEGPETLCLNEDRFEVKVNWEKPDGETGAGQAVELTGDTGYFWFFSDNNVELVVKLLDGRDLNDYFWVFYGALSNVRYTMSVTDKMTGEQRIYINPQDNFASVGDTMAFFAPSDPGKKRDTALSRAASDREAAAATRVARPLTMPEKNTVGVKGSGGCMTTETELCLNQDRFLFSVDWQRSDGVEGVGKAVALTGDTGYFWFFSENNVELIVKLLDGQDQNGFYWVFYGALSNVAYTLKVTDTLTGREVTYTNPQDNFASVGDTMAFDIPKP